MPPDKSLSAWSITLPLDRYKEQTINSQAGVLDAPTDGVRIEAPDAAGAVHALSGFVGLGVLPTGTFLERKGWVYSLSDHAQRQILTIPDSLYDFLRNEEGTRLGGRPSCHEDP